MSSNWSVKIKSHYNFWYLFFIVVVEHYHVNSEHKYISMINETDFFYQWWVMIKDCEKFIIISHYDLKTVSIALMSYQEFLSYAQCMINMILHSYKFFVCYYIDDIIIFSKTLEDYLQHLNMIFNLFNKFEITLKKIKTHLDYLSIILLD